MRAGNYRSTRRKSDVSICQRPEKEQDLGKKSGVGLGGVGL